VEESSFIGKLQYANLINEEALRGTELPLEEVVEMQA
jgi:hypothetical protein